MKIRSLFVPGIIALTLAAPLLAGSHDEKAKKAAEAAMMEAWMKSMSPGEAHKKLEPFVGTFNVTLKAWMAPDAQPMESSGVAESSWSLGGRYVQQRYKGTFMDMPFEGLGYTGYDNVAKKYVGSWMDNMSTGMMLAEGALEKDGKTFTFRGTMLDPVSGKPQEIKETITVVSNDEHLVEMWGPAADGKIFKTMEIRYTRKK